MRPTVRIKNFFRLLEEEWIKQSPDLRFCQFLFNNGIVDTGGILYHQEEYEILQKHFPQIPVREYLMWGTYGRRGTNPLKHVLLKDMSNDHINAILSTQTQITDFYRKALTDELEYRRNSNIKIED